MQCIESTNQQYKWFTLFQYHLGLFGAYTKELNLTQQKTKQNLRRTEAKGVGIMQWKRVLKTPLFFSYLG